MDYPIKMLDQLPLVLKGFRKQRGLTQAAIAFDDERKCRSG